MLEALNLCKAFDGKAVISNLSFHLEPGVHYCLMGPSGCGKTTLLNLLMGLLKPDSGSIRTKDGLRISAVFQEDRLLKQMTAQANIALVNPAAAKEADLLLKELGIAPESLPQPVSAYSGGMKRRVALARALLADFDILFLDEPYKGLDEDTRANVMRIVSRYTKGKTVVLVTHDAEEAIGCTPIQI